MNYLVSDIHGDALHFWKLLKKLHLDYAEDYLYIIGDIVDRGAGSVKLFLEILNLQQQFPEHIVILKGNHEYFLRQYLNGELSERLYASFGGASAISELDTLDEITKKQLVLMIEQLPIFTEVVSPQYGTMLLVHSGLCDDSIVYNEDQTINVRKSIDLAVKEDERNFLVSNHIHTMSTVKLDTYMVVGHVPTIFLEPAQPMIYKRKNLMCIDCGAGYRMQGGKLGIYCMETDEEYYL